MKLSLLFPLLLGLLCIDGGGSKRSENRQRSGGVPPAVDPVDTVTDFIELEILQGGTPEELVEFFSDDALVVHSGQPAYEGKDEIKAALSWTDHVDLDGDYTVVKVFGGNGDQDKNEGGSGSRRHGLRKLQSTSNASPGVYVHVQMTVTPRGGDGEVGQEPKPYILKYREFYSLVKDEDDEYKIALLINNEEVDKGVEEDHGHANL